MNPEDRRARLITTFEGKYVNVEDFVEALKDDEFVKFCSTMILVGQKVGVSPTECVRRAIACAMMTLAGDAGWAHRLRMEREKKQ